MASKMMRGSPILMGDSTIPGVVLPKELQNVIPNIMKAATDFGLVYYPTVVQMLTYDEISEVASYGGFPVRYPHWRWGMEYNELQQGYEHGLHRIYEMVVNSNPCYIYCLDSNTLVDNVTVVAHALGHNDFFKNNVYFSPTSQNMMNELANHGTRIRKYMQRWGKEKVTEFLDHVLRITTLVDPASAWEQRKFKDPIKQDVRHYHHPKHLPVQEGHDYMEPWLNPEEWMKEQRKRLEKREVAEELNIFKEPTKDILRYIRDYAPLQPWQSDIVAMIYEEEIYFSPQRPTKMLNEGWASFVDFNLMAVQGFVSLGQSEHDNGIVEYAIHKMGVLGGKYSMNPYKLGFCIFQDIEERWNKGQFGPLYDECRDIKQREDWDEKLGLGHDKVLEVRKFYNDFTAISEFFTEDFCNKYEFFEWEHRPNGEYVIKSRDYKKIKKKLIGDYLNGGLPDVRLADPNHLNRGHMLLQHQWDGYPLYPSYAKDTILSLRRLWGLNREVILATRDKDGEELIYVTRSPDTVVAVNRQEYDKIIG
ncbi:MAG: SpoVR family protein [Proteobacteria bacterium]|nr:SpoVR family protein [Pseudomonadota bacterium]